MQAIMTQHHLLQETVSLLSEMIATPSHSRDEGKAADLLEQRIHAMGIATQRWGHNIMAADPYFDSLRPTVLLNAHIDTVKPSTSWTRDPYTPAVEDGKLYGLGSNDCGGGLITLLMTYRQLRDVPRHFNLIYLASSEEEVSGQEGIVKVLPHLPKIDVAIVGEPTGMHPAVAERGLMVLDLVAHGKSGHAAREEGENAIYKAIDDMAWIRDYRFEKVSPLLGPTKMTLTVVHSGTQHNVVPDKCEMLVDVRTNELYTNEEVYDIIRQHVACDVHAHSFRLHSSCIPMDHPLVKRCIELGRVPYGSPTLSDQALMPFPSFKLGPGESARSHTADEFIFVEEIAQALELYPKLLHDFNAE